LACGAALGTGDVRPVAGPGGPFGPCCGIKEAFCATAAGKVGPTDPVATAGAVPGVTALLTTDLLITLLMTVVLWMLAKMMLLGGGAT
jgi:hypothetical protein